MKHLEYLFSFIVTTTFFYLSYADTYILYDTKPVSSDLDWTYHPTYDGWEELSGLDVDGKSIRYHQVCNVDSPGQNNWARSPFIDAKSAKRVYIDLEFSVMKCDECRETFTLYYYPSSTNVASTTFPPWREKPFIKIDTVAANARFESDAAGPQGINKKTLAIGPLTRSGFYVAVQDQGACMSIVSMKIYYHYCPELTHNLAYFPKTVTGGDLASLIQVDGKCVSNAIYSNNEVPKYRCNTNGEWKVPTGNCQCRPGYSPNKDRSACNACPAGQYKTNSGNHACMKCPSHSSSFNLASASCPCDYGYYRSATETVDQPCTQPPSGPSDLDYVLNQTSVELSWSSPMQTGNRNDLYYSVECRECDERFDKCSDCSSRVRFQPNPKHVTMTSMKVSHLELFSNYVFTVTSYNGVSSVSGKLSASDRIRVSTVDPLPSPVTNVRLIGSSPDSLTLRWSNPLRSNGKIRKYEVKSVAVSDNGTPQDVKVKSVSHLNYTIIGLKPGTSYVIKVRGFIEAGWGPYSAPVTYTTKADSQVNSHDTQGGDSPVVIIIIAVVGVASLTLGVAIFCLIRRKRRERNEANRVRSKLAGEAGVGLLDQGNMNVSAPGAKTTRKTYVDYRDPHQGVKEIACEVEVSRIKIERVIGQGEFGEVCRGRLAEGKTSTTVAVKRLRHGASLIDQTNFLREACTMAQFHDPNIVLFKGVVTKSMPAMILSEFMENGSLDRFLQKKRGELSLVQLLNFLKGIASGMRYLSNMKYIHRDLAARNILVDDNLNCKVSDFGLSRTLENNPHATYTTQGGKIALRWTAPECIRHRQFTTASDVWSYGIVMWEVMSYGEKPYWDMSNDDVTQVIEDGYRLPAPENCPQVLHNLMLQCWCYDERRRPSFPEIIVTLDQFIQQPQLLQDKCEMLELGAPLLSPDTPTSIQDVNTLDEWLDMVKLGRYRRSFYDYGINDLHSLIHITPSDLERLGIASLEHRSRLQSGLATLRRHIGAGQDEGAGASGPLRTHSQASSLLSTSMQSFNPPSPHIQGNFLQPEVALV